MNWVYLLIAPALVLALVIPLSYFVFRKEKPQVLKYKCTYCGEENIPITPPGFEKTSRYVWCPTCGRVGGVCV